MRPWGRPGSCLGARSWSGDRHPHPRSHARDPTTWCWAGGGRWLLRWGLKDKARRMFRREESQWETSEARRKRVVGRCGKEFRVSGFQRTRGEWRDAGEDWGWDEVLCSHPTLRAGGATEAEVWGGSDASTQASCSRCSCWGLVNSPPRLSLCPFRFGPCSTSYRPSHLLDAPANKHTLFKSLMYFF